MAAPNGIGLLPTAPSPAAPPGVPTAPPLHLGVPGGGPVALDAIRQDLIRARRYQPGDLLRVGANGDLERLPFPADRGIVLSRRRDGRPGWRSDVQVRSLEVLDALDTDPGALTDSTGGTTDGILAPIAGSGADTEINNNFAELAEVFNLVRGVLAAAGYIQ